MENKNPLTFPGLLMETPGTAGLKEKCVVLLSKRNYLRRNALRPAGLFFSRLPLLRKTVSFSQFCAYLYFLAKNSL